MPAFTESDTARLAGRLKESEGLRLSAYRCTAGALTVGYGHNCDASPVPGIAKAGDRISREQAEALFEKDLAAAVWQVRKALPWVGSLNTPRQAVLYDMAFNMGLGGRGKSGLLSFVNTLARVESGDFAGAAKGMRASKWASQVGLRAEILARQMETGAWQR